MDTNSQKFLSNKFFWNERTEIFDNRQEETGRNKERKIEKEGIFQAVMPESIFYRLYITESSDSEDVEKVCLQNTPISFQDFKQGLFMVGSSSSKRKQLESGHIPGTL